MHSPNHLNDEDEGVSNILDDHENDYDDLIEDEGMEFSEDLLDTDIDEFDYNDYAEDDSDADEAEKYGLN